MTDYGVTSIGYVRKPIEVILAELEAAMITEFGAGVIQTAQSPLGQINGLMADMLAELDELCLDVYQSYDPDQAEGSRLDTLARLRLISRTSASDAVLRQAITNAGVGRIDYADVVTALLAVPDVTHARVLDGSDVPSGHLAIVVEGGVDADIAGVIHPYIVPGISTYGNHRIDFTVDGRCRSIVILRPIAVAVSVDLGVALHKSRVGCPAPSVSAIAAHASEAWASMRTNGLSLTRYVARQLVETMDGVELVTFAAGRDGDEPALNVEAEIGTVEIADLTVTVYEV